MSPAKRKGQDSYLNKGHWKWSMEKCWPVLTVDFSKFTPEDILQDKPFKLTAEDQSPCAIAGRNLKHIGIFHYNDVATAPDGEVYDRNHIEVDTKAQRIRISGAENVRLLRVWANHHNPKLETILNQAEKKFRSQYKHHKNLAEWSAEVHPDGIPVIAADFSRLVERDAGEEKNPHYWGAVENLKSFGKLRSDEGNDVVYDSRKWTIQISGNDNARIFSNWIAINDPPLRERFDRDGITSKLSVDMDSAAIHEQRLVRQRGKDPSIEMFPDEPGPQEGRGH